MAIKVREGSLHKVSNILDPCLVSSTYEAFRSIGTEHDGNQIKIFLACSAHSVAANCSSSICESYGANLFLCFHVAGKLWLELNRSNDRSSFPCSDSGNCLSFVLCGASIHCRKQLQTIILGFQAANPFHIWIAHICIKVTPHYPIGKVPWKLLLMPRNFTDQPKHRIALIVAHPS